MQGAGNNNFAFCAAEPLSIFDKLAAVHRHFHATEIALKKRGALRVEHHMVPYMFGIICGY